MLRRASQTSCSLPLPWEEEDGDLQSFWYGLRTQKRFHDCLVGKSACTCVGPLARSSCRSCVGIYTEKMIL